MTKLADTPLTDNKRKLFMKEKVPENISWILPLLIETMTGIRCCGQIKKQKTNLKYLAKNGQNINEKPPKPLYNIVTEASRVVLQIVVQRILWRLIASDILPRGYDLAIEESLKLCIQINTEMVACHKINVLRWQSLSADLKKYWKPVVWIEKNKTQRI